MAKKKVGPSGKTKYKKKVVSKPAVDEDDVDYAAVADSFFEKEDDEVSPEKAPRRAGTTKDVPENDSSSSEDEDAPEGGGKDRNDDDDDDSEESESEADQDDDDGSRDDDSEDDSEEAEGGDDDDEEEGAEQQQQQQTKSTKWPFSRHKIAALPASISATGEQCTFDLRNLLAMNSHQVDTSKLYAASSGKAAKKKMKEAQAEKLTIVPAMAGGVDEEYLLEKATDGCTQLIAALWQLPVERSDAGPMATLPSYDESRIPRTLPVPPPKQETKWEKFAKEKGIALNDKKRSRKVWDEDSGKWMYRTGYEKANSNNKEWPIMEVKDSEDPYDDPWEKQRDAKKTRVEKNMESRMRNQERAGALAKGTTNRAVKSREKIRQAGKEGGNLDRDNVPPSGVPVDLQPRKGDGDANAQQQSSLNRGKASTVKALLATQRSTASLGKFDKLREGEPERKKALAGLKKKRKFENATDKKVISGEAERNRKILRAVVAGGGAAKERDIKKGKLATGETAYDYDFDDGLGASTFRKKKGRAGGGKAKKMTKKRIK